MEYLNFSESYKDDKESLQGGDGAASSYLPTENLLLRWMMEFIGY
jgi:hypothetical protein